MFGDLMGNMQAQQAEMQKRLKEMPIEVSREGLRIKGNAAKEVHDVEISDELSGVDNKEQLQDLLIAIFTEFNALADSEQEKLTQNLLNDVLPGGLGGLGGMFGM